VLPGLFSGFGWSFADMGDLDNDGVSDFVTGVPQEFTNVVASLGTSATMGISGATGAILHFLTPIPRQFSSFAPWHLQGPQRFQDSVTTLASRMIKTAMAFKT